MSQEDKPVAECCNQDCEWRGDMSECVMLGSVDPLCPECREVVEIFNQKPELCGAWAGNGYCTLPKGHNIGNLDIPDNHKCDKPVVAQEPFGYWHQAETDEESDFFPVSYCHGAGSDCPKCIPLYTNAAPCARCQATAEEKLTYDGITSNYFAHGGLDWMQNINAAMKEPVFQEARALMGTENYGQDVALLQALRKVRSRMLQNAKSLEPIAWAVISGDGTGAIFLGAKRPSGFDKWPNTKVLPVLDSASPCPECAERPSAADYGELNEQHQAAQAKERTS